jgi:hypothetical protein
MGPVYYDSRPIELVVGGPNDISAHWACSMVQKCKEEKRRVGEEVMQM